MATKYNYTKIINGKEYKYFRVTRVVGTKKNGLPEVKEFLGNGEKEANKKADEYMAKLELGLVNNFDKLTLADCMSNWIYNVKKYDDIKPSTFESYEGTFRNYVQNSDIANLKLFNIKSIKLQEHYNKLSKNGFSSSKIKKLNKLLYQYFQYAIKEGYINRNPADNINIPKLEEEKKHKENKIEYYTEDEVKKIKEKVKGYDIELIVLMAIGTGLREGELLALKYSDIDYNNKQLKVNRTTKMVTAFDSDNNKHREQQFLEPKTKNSKRIVDIPSSLFELIPKSDKDDLLFKDEKGNIWEPRKLYRHWNYFLKKNDLPKKKFHSLRHTYATLLLSKGVELITISKLLGHSSLQITEIYADVIPQLKNDSVDKLNSLF